MKFLSRLFTALNLLPSIATLAFVSSPISRHSSTKLRADLADRRAIVLAEIGDRLVVGRKPAQQPDHFEIAPGLALQPPARLDAVEIAVDVELQENRGMIGRPTGCRRLDTLEAQLAKIERIDERIDRANRIALVDPVIEAFRQQRRLTPIRPFNEALHRSPPQIARRIIAETAFSRSQGQKRTMSIGHRHVYSSLESGRARLSLLKSAVGPRADSNSFSG